MRVACTLKHKPILILITALLLVSLCACGKKNKIEESITDNGTDAISTTDETDVAVADTVVESGEIEIPLYDKDKFPRIDGSTATLPLGRLMYRMSTGATELEAAENIVFSKTTESYIRLMNSDTDLVIAYEAGEKALKDPGYQDLDIVPIGLDALVFLCNEANSVDNLTSEEIRGIYTGKVTNWKDMGGGDTPVIPFQRPENSGSQTLMEKVFMNGEPMMEALEGLAPGEMGDLIEAVASYDNSEGAIGYSVYYYASNMYKVPEVKLISVDGVMPDSETIRSGEYSYVNPFYAAIRKDEPEDSPAHILFNWLTEADGQSLINGLGYVGVKDSVGNIPDEYIPSAVSIDTGDTRLVIDAGSYNGNAGVIVFDRNLKIEKYISEAQIDSGNMFAIARNGLLIARDTANKDGYGNTGLYNIETNQWVVRPEYEIGAIDLIVSNGPRYYFYNYESDDDGNFSSPVTVWDKAGNELKEYVDNDVLSNTYQFVDPDSYRYDFQDDYSDLYFADKVKIHRDDTESGGAQLFVDDKLVEKADVGNVLPLEGVIEITDQLPYGYIAFSLYDIVDTETYRTANNRYVIINDKGEIAYTVNLGPSEWVEMANDDYCIIYGQGGLYKIVNPEGELINSWRYYEYDETRDDDYYYDDYEYDRSAINNGHYFVKVDDCVYFREYGKSALENPTIWGEYLLNPTGEHSYISYYDETLGQTIQAFDDDGFGNIVYMDGHFFLNGLDFSTSEYGDPYVYSVDKYGEIIAMPDIIHGTIKGVSKDNDMFFVENTYVGSEYQPVIAGISSDGEEVFRIESANRLTYLGTAYYDYLLYAEVIYEEDEETRVSVWCRDIYDGDTVWITDLVCDGGESLDYGEIFTSEGMCYLPVVARAGTANIFQNGYALSFFPGVGGSGQATAEFYADENDIPLVSVDGVERALRDHDDDTYYIKRKSYEESGDLYLKHKNGQESLEVRGIIPYSDYYKIGKNMTLAESVDKTGYIMLATQIYDETGSIGWRDGFRLLKMEYLRINGDGTYDVIQTVRYE